MVIRIFSALFFLCLITATAAAQIIGSTDNVINGPLHDLIDARSSALGESWAARTRTPSAWNSNPASLAGSIGTGLELTRRDAEIASRFNHFGIGAWLSTPVGEFALNYRHLDFGNLRNTFDTTVITQITSDYGVIALSYATNILSPVAIGASIKHYTVFFGSNRTSASSFSSFYADLGLMISRKGFLGADSGIDSLHGGIAVQNLGGTQDDREGLIPGPIGQFLRAGIAYDAGLFITDGEPLLRASATAEYRRLLNPAERKKDEVDFAGAGLELTAYNLSFRLGTVIAPGANYFAAPHTLALRYGFGARLPLHELGIDVPITLSADYAYLPSSTDYFPSSDPSMRDGITIRAEYTESVFK